MTVTLHYRQKIQVPFMLTPPVARVALKSGQRIKIKKMPNSLPDESKESLFYLNVLDIPQTAGRNAGKILANSQCRIENKN